MSSPIKIGRLNQIRENDAEGESTLDPKKMREFLAHENITADTFEDMFTFDTAIKILQGYDTGGAADTIEKLEHLRTSLAELGREDILEDETDPEAFRSTIYKELLAAKTLKAQDQLVTEFDMYITIRNYAKRSLEIEKEIDMQLEDHKALVESSLGDSFKSGATEFVNDVKKSWSKMPNIEKLAAVSAIVIGVIWMSGDSENQTITKTKKALWKIVKYGGFGLLANYGIKLFTGKSGIEHLDSATADSRDPEWWTAGFDTDEKKAALLRKSLVYMGDLDFEGAARRYKNAENGEVDLSDVGVTDMTPKECYIAMHVFFKRYGDDVDGFIEQYEGRSAKWKDVVTYTMVEDGRLKGFGVDTLDRAKGGAYEYGVRAWNWMAVGEGIGISKAAYVFCHGREGTDIEVENFVKDRFRLVKNEASIPEFIDEKLSEEYANNYKLAWAENPDTDTIEGASIRSLEVPGESSFACVTVEVDGTSQDARAQAVKKVQDSAKEYFKKEFGDKQKVEGFIKPSHVAFALKETSCTLLVRLPLKGSEEYSRIAIGLAKPGDTIEDKGEEIFRENSEIIYNDLERWQQERIRIHFLLDSEQNNEIQDVCNWVAKKYRTEKGGTITFNKVLEELYTDKDLRDEALEGAGVTNQELSKGGGLGLKNALEKELAIIEKEAAEDLKGRTTDYENAIREMRRLGGYRVRLAILGDTAARKRNKYYPPMNNPEQLKNSYKEKCINYVKEANQFTPGYWDWMKFWE
jgi:metal-responsive CopG/Arc/MetJ family transcriptional regulator